MAPPFLILALDGGNGQPYNPASPPLGKELLVPTGQDAGSAPEPVLDAVYIKTSCLCQELNPS
jgi:hypothetical protein